MEGAGFQSACDGRWDRPRSRMPDRAAPNCSRKPSGRALGPRLVPKPVRLGKDLLGRRFTGGLLHLPRSQRLTMRTVAAHLSSRQQDLKCEVAFDLAAQPLQRLAEKLFHLPAPQADHMRVLLLHTRFVVMLVPA